MEALIALLLDVAARDERLYRLLLLKTERAAGPAGTLKAFRRAIDSATKTRDFVDWQEAGAYAADLDQMADSLQELLTADGAALLVGLAERAIERIEHALEQVDDSNGQVSGVLERIAALHLAACELAQPDPEQLAERLFRYEMTLPFETFLDSARVYRNALGTAGLQRLRELATVEWGKVQPQEADAGITASYDSERSSSITNIMETLAEISGDIEQQVAIKSRDLSSAYRFLDIAEIYLKAGQTEQALAWAERGLQAFAASPDNRLRDFLVARAADAISLYRRVIPQIVEKTSNTAYEDAIRLIRRVGQLMTDLGQSGALADYLVALRLQYKQKRNFIKLLDGIKSTRF